MKSKNYRGLNGLRMPVPAVAAVCAAALHIAASPAAPAAAAPAAAAPAAAAAAAARAAPAAGTDTGPRPGIELYPNATGVLETVNLQGRTNTHGAGSGLPETLRLQPPGTSALRHRRRREVIQHLAAHHRECTRPE